MNGLRRAWTWAAAIAGTTVALAGSVPSALAEAAPSFDLPRRGTDERVRLEDFAGQILVLDFFAFWCAPCERASKELETGLQQFYALRNGNSRGVSVRVVSVNIEKDVPGRTDEFLRRTGASFVVNDFAGSLLKELGSAGIPFLVIVDGSGSRPGAPRFEIVYKHAGFEGTGKLRQIIDGLGGPAGAAAQPGLVKRGRPATEERGGGPPLVQTIEADSEFVFASDIFLTDSKLRYGQERGGTQWDAAVSYISFDMDYRPNNLFDFLGFDEHLHKERVSGLVNVRQRLLEPLTFLGSAGIYDGYPDYRRVWIANRYRQKYANPAFPTIPGYVAPDPKGMNVSVGARWEYLPTLAFAELKLGYAHDKTAPGYEDTTPNGMYVLVRGRERLETRTLSFSTENVLTARLRMLNEFTFTQTSGRQLRFIYQGSLNLALGERWVLRGYGGLATEAPTFNAHFFGATAEYELRPNLLLSLTGRYYKDTGEIENSLLLSSAAPALESWEAGVGLRYSWRHSSLKVYVAPFRTSYAALNLASAEFLHLYADRNWGLAQIAWTVQF